MIHKNYFKRINFNKRWDESDWEKYFQAHDAYRLSRRLAEIRKKPLPKINFDKGDEVEAFEPILREYGADFTPGVINELKSIPFAGDQNPEEEYAPFTNQDSHFWGEGAPLASLPLYRDCCRFSIQLAKELDRFLRKRDDPFRQKFLSAVKNLRFHANWVAINVAQGHQIGYAKERISGNVAKCRRAVKHIDQCLGLLNRLSKHTKSLAIRRELFSFSAQLRRALFIWIDELRSRLA